MKMEEKIKKAMSYMEAVMMKEGRDWFSPTEIGKHVGGTLKHSSYGSPICKEAVKRGYMERNTKGHYRLTVICL